MATTTTTHCKMGIVDASGNVNVLYPQTTGADVSITPNSAAADATTVQALVNALTASAFISNFSGIDDSSTSSTVKTWSANKINSEISTLNSNLAKLNQNLPNFVSAYFNISVNTPVGIHTVGSLSTIFGISNLTQQRLASIVLWVQEGNTGVVGDHISYLIYIQNLYIKIEQSPGYIMKIGASAQYF